MDFLQAIVDLLNTWVVNFGIPVGEETVPFMVLFLLGVGVFLTLRLGFVQLRHFAHGVGVATGRYDDPNEPGDVSHFQALTTALSATVGIGNIAGVAIAIHFGGPGALFWMWVTAALGMATKYAEVTLAQRYRVVEGQDRDAHKWEGTVSGGPMYYIERGMGPSWRWMALFFAVILAFTAFVTGNATQANTVADAVESTFGVAPWITGAVTAGVVSAVILGGITRIGAVTGVLAPLMAGIYVLGALTVILLNASDIVPTFALIFREAFNPTAGVAGTGVGAFLVTLMWGVRRGLFSNEAGQGSAPIAHAAAKTDEPVSEGVVALLEPFIDTIVICTMTALVIITTGVWSERHPTAIEMAGGDLVWVTRDADGRRAEAVAPEEYRVLAGEGAGPSGGPNIAWHDVEVEGLFTDEGLTNPFTGSIYPGRNEAVAEDGTVYRTLYGNAVETAAPLTMLGFRRGLAPLGDWGHYIVLVSVMLFAVSTAISWSYYGDRCANYIFGPKAILPYKVAFVTAHFLGAIIPLQVVWDLGDALLAVVIVPNLIALVWLSSQVKNMTDSYFERRPWVENAEVQRRHREARRRE